MIDHLAAKAPRHRLTVAIGIAAGALAVLLPAGPASAVVTVPHAPKPPEVTVPSPAPAPGSDPASPPAISVSPPSGGQGPSTGPGPSTNGDSGTSTASGNSGATGGEAPSSASDQSTESGQDESGNGRPDGNQLGYVDIARQQALAQQQQQQAVATAIQYANILTGDASPSEEADFFDSLSNIGQMISDSLANSDGSGTGNVVMDLIGKAWNLLNGTTACPKAKTPDGKVGLCQS